MNNRAGFTPNEPLKSSETNLTSTADTCQQLQTELHHYRLLYEKLSSIYFTLDARGIILSINPKGSQRLGYTPEQLVNRSIFNLIHPNCRPVFQHNFSLSSRCLPIPATWEAQLQTSEGNFLWVSVVVESAGEPDLRVIYMVCEDITTTKQTAIDLQESVALQRLVFREISDTIFITDDQGKFTFICPNLETIFNYFSQEKCEILEVSDLLGRDFFKNFIIPFIAEKEIEVIHNIEHSITDTEGILHTLLVTIKRVNIRQGTLLYTCRDITSNKKAETALRQNQALLHNVLNSLPVGVWIADKEGNVQINLAIQNIWDFPESLRQSRLKLAETDCSLKLATCQINEDKNSPFLGWWLDTNKRLKPEEWPLVKAFNNGEKTLNKLVNIQSFTGQRKTLLISAVPLQSEQGENIGAISINQDVTQHRLVENALWENQRLIQQISEATPTILYIYDVIKQENIYANGQINKILGYSPEEVQTMRNNFFALLLHPEDRQKLYENMARLNYAKDGEIVETEYRLRAKNGEWRWLYSRDTVFRRNSEDKPQQTLGTAMDITRRKQVEQELHRYQHHLEQLVTERTAKLKATNQRLQQEISERKQAELALKESQHFIEKITDTNPAILYVYDLVEKKNIYINSFVIQSLGYSPQEIQEMGENLLKNLLHPDDYAQQKAWYKPEISIRNGDIFSIEFRMRHKSGEWRYFQANETLFNRTPEGKPKQILGCASDITERVRVQDKLQWQEAVLRAMAGASPLAFYVVDHQSDEILYFNRRFCEIWGLTHLEESLKQGEFKSQEILKMCKPLVINEATFKNQRKYLKGLETSPLLEDELSLKDGRMIRRISSLVCDENRNYIGWLSIFEDITQRKQAEEAVRYQERKFRTLAENTPDIISRLDRKLHYLYINPAIEKATGLLPETFLGKTKQEVGMPEQLIEIWQQASEQVFETGTEKTIEFSFASPTGIRHYQTHIVPEFDTDKSENVVSILAISRDITLLKQTQHSLQIAQARLEHLVNTSPAVIYSAPLSDQMGANFITNNISAVIGYDAEELRQNSQFWIDNLHPEDQAGVFKELPRLFEQGYLSLEYRFRHKDGNYRWVYDKMQLVYDSAGHPIEAVGSWIDITDRKQAEEQLIWLSQAVESASDAITISNLNARCIYSNRAFLEMFGYNFSQLNTSGGAKILFASQSVAEEVFNSLMRGDSWMGEVQMHKPDGKVFHTLLRAYAIKDSTHKPVGLVFIHTDISERRQAIAALQEREVRFRTLAETVSAAIFISQGTQLRYVNSAAETLTGYTREELLLGGTNLIHPKFAKLIRRRFRAGMNNPFLHQKGKKVASRYEFKHTTKTGQERWAEFSMALMEYDGNIAVLSAAFDITDRKIAQKSLEYRAVFLQLISDISTHFLNLSATEIDTGIQQTLHALAEFIAVDRTMVFFFSEDGHTMSNTHEWCGPGIEPQIHQRQNLSLDVFAYTAEILKKDEPVQISSLADFPESATAEKQQFEEGGYQALLRVPLSAGGEVVGSIGCDRIRINKNWTEHDITLLKIVGEIIVSALDRRRFEAALQQHAGELARSNAELEQFAYIASHDLQEPLRAVMSYTQLLARRYQDQLDEKANEFIYFAVDGATRMQVLIQDLLAYSRVGTKGKALVPVDGNAVLDQALANLQIAINESNATIIRPELPIVLGDSTQLVQLFQNLIGNSIKYRSSKLPVIEIQVQSQESDWLFLVRDNGIGFDAKYRERVFLIFQRLHTREEYAGTGIGLAVCKKIVERHGGKIWVDSSVGMGSTFYFTIPQSR
ncbi:PAS domain S-box protein [Ancylothrix sp. C2]|uniref:PAS domain S-box protein n=1 Tax=Ancylothrix sp. D3o TaxID=2953691 RepID=UPI0021BB7239|nr:PAS domain S-box protein [Ancylothrix sp. D3o]MCT7949984.1 PAS domain S-box protein [Ancylothrix sp. D3o]